MDPMMLLWLVLILGVVAACSPGLRAALRALKGLAILGVAFLVAGVLAGQLMAYAGGTGTGIRSHPQGKPSQLAKANIPASYLKLYRDTGKRTGVAWNDLAGIYQVESLHGQGTAPGIRSGVNRHGCCAGPGQFHIKNGHHGGIRGSTWDTYGTGIRSQVYRPKYAIPATAKMLKANSYGDKVPRPGYRRCPGVNARPGTINAIRHYNNSCGYVREVLTWSERYRTGRTA